MDTESDGEKREKKRKDAGGENYKQRDKQCKKRKTERAGDQFSKSQFSVFPSLSLYLFILLTL